VQAQPFFIISDIPARWYWEGSADGGGSWSRNQLEVHSASTRVRIRAICEFVGPSNTYFGGASFDGVVTGSPAIGQGDTIRAESITRGQVQNILPPLAVSRWGSSLKIDYWDDHAPPGLGPYWASTSQSAPFRGPHVSGNPLNVFEYELHLDGTIGERSISAIFANEPFFGPGGWIRLFRENDFNERDNTYMHPVEQHALTIRAVPAPSTVILVPIALTFLSRKRRPSCCRWPAESRSM
jgi:hypothetical protein